MFDNNQTLRHNHIHRLAMTPPQLELHMIGYVYAVESKVLVATITGNNNSDIEHAFERRYDADAHGLTYSPAIGAVDGLVDNGDADAIDLLDCSDDDSQILMPRATR